MFKKLSELQNAILFELFYSKYHSVKCEPLNSRLFSFLFRAMCHPMVARQAWYKYLIIVIVLSFSLEFPRFFEMKLTQSATSTRYWTTSLMENPFYVRFRSYWDELFVSGFVPLFTLCYMNLRIFLKIKVK